MLWQVNRRHRVVFDIAGFRAFDATCAAMIGRVNGLLDREGSHIRE
jgi:hypothetical protein